jgi:hypothetical protein
MDAAEAVITYGASWNEPDVERRRSMLEQVWADDGVYTDPTVELPGREALIEHISGFQQSFAGARIEPTSGVEVHHGWLRFSWSMLDGSGTVLTEGFDVGQLDDDGRIKLIVGFFGPFPPAN